MTPAAAGPRHMVTRFATVGFFCLIGAFSTALSAQALDTATLQARLESLRAEFEAGENQLQALDARRTELTNTMLRISGAIQVIEELLAEPPAQ